MGHNAPQGHQFYKSQSANSERISGTGAAPSLSQYTKLDHNDKNKVWATYIAGSRSKQQLPDEELLNLFSPKYFNETDAFKKHEIIKTELPRIKQELAMFRSQNYYSLDFTGSDDPVDFTVVWDPYNFDKKGFGFGSDKCFSGMIYINPQSVSLTFNVANKNLCEFKVDSVDAAKVIETARNADFGIKLHGTMYFVVNSLNEVNHNIDTTILHAKYKVFKGGYVPKDEKLIAESEL